MSLRRTTATASLSSPGSPFCGGTLISNTYVLTAAHCTASITAALLPNYFVVVGAQYRNDTNPVRLTVKSLIIHELYNDSTYENDIALWELSAPVDFSNSKNGFICLPPNGVVTYPTDAMSATAIGWGRLTEGGSSSYTLQQVQLPIVSYSNQYCANVVANNSLQFCAGLIAGGKDTCQGDRYREERI